MIPRIYIPGDSGALALGAEKVAKAVRAELAERGIEAKIVLVPRHSLPQTSSGKLSRSRARTMYLAGAFAPADAASE